MALNKQTLNINFSQGVNTKTDPFQVPAGQFLSLKNSVFTEAGLMSKRNGYGYLSIVDDDVNYLTTFNGNLTAIGTELNAYSQSSMTWVDKGPIHPVKLSVSSLVRSNTNQSQADSVVASNGLVCTAFTDAIPDGSGGTTPSYKYVIADSQTGQNIVPPTVIPVGTGAQAGAPRVFLLGRYFFIVYTVLISATNHLQALAINTSNVSQTIEDIDISSQYTPASTLAFDGIVANNNLYLAWNGSDLGGAIRATYIDSTLTQHSTVTFTSKVATIFSLAADLTTPSPIIYISFYNSGTALGYTAVVDSQLSTVHSPVQIIASGVVHNLASTAQNGVCTIYYEKANNYTYDSSIATHIIAQRTVTQGGAVGAASNLVRGVGLASKAFLLDSIPYFLAIYNSIYQPTYFLINSVGKQVSKLAYSNGGSYYLTGISNITVQDNVIKIPYLIKDLIQSVNKTQGLANPAGIYTQTGVNLASFTIGETKIVTSEIGGSLHLSGGFLWQYDGNMPVEHSFHLYPDYVEATGAATGGAMKAQEYFYQALYEWTDNLGNIHRSAPSIPLIVDLSASSPSAISFTSVFSSGASSITVSSTSGLQVGQVITDATTPGNIQAGTKITAIVGSVVSLSLPTAGNSASTPGDTLNTVTRCSVTINVPTLRLTYKTANPVKIVIYRWSTDQQNYYQVTSVNSPLLNSLSVDYVTFVDTAADSTILGNSLIYTTGGVLENIAAPATNVSTLFNNRLWLIDAEDDNNIWFSKQVIQATPVEMSDLLTMYIPPTAATAGAPGTGPLKCLSALDDKLILFKTDAIYYLNGVGPDNTGTNSQYSDAVFITAVVGCDNQASIVFMPNGLMFQSNKGIWLLGRDLSTSYIGAQVEQFTQNATVLSAVSVPETTQVRFTLDSGVTLMYDYFYGQWGTFTNVAAISSTIYQGLHTYVSNQAQVYQETPGKYLDGSNPVLMSFTTSWLNLAGVQGYQRAYFFYLLGTYLSPHKLSIQIAYDYNSSPTQQTIISPDNFTPNYGNESVWGGGGPWGGKGNLEQWRIFLAQQKCQAFQITFNEVYDASFGVTAGAGLTLSGLDIVVGAKSGYPRLRASRQAG